MVHTRYFTAVVLSVFTLSALAAPATRGIKVKKVIDADFADPAVTIFDGTWYAFATTGNGVNVQVATSKDFDNWTVQKGLDALPKVGKWADQRDRAVWAPDVVMAGNGKYVMYYSAKLPGLHRHCVGAAVGDKPTGPFRPLDEPFVCPSAQGGAIDPSGYREDGKRYVVYKVDGNNIGRGGNCNNGIVPLVPTPIMLQQVSAADGFTKIGGPVQILDRGAGDGPLVEAPSLTKTADGKYVLFFSSNCYAGPNYDVAYAFADKITGPYTKAGPFAVTGNAGLYAPGGADIAPDGKRMVFHASNGRGGRGVFTAQITIDARNRMVYT